MAGVVQIRNVPDDTRRLLEAQAAAKGLSFNDYLLALLIEKARPTVREVLERAARRSEKLHGSSVDIIRADRDGH